MWFFADDMNIYWMSQNGLKTLSSNRFCCIQHHSHLRSNINVLSQRRPEWLFMFWFKCHTSGRRRKQAAAPAENQFAPTGFKFLRKILSWLSPGTAPHETSSHCLTTGRQHKRLIQGQPNCITTLVLFNYCYCVHWFYWFTKLSARSSWFSFDLFRILYLCTLEVYLSDEWS